MVVRCSLLGLLVVVIAGAGSTAYGSPLDLFGFGARSAGMAGTGVASATGYDAVYLNPAGLADAVRKRVTIGGVGGELFLFRDDRQTPTDAVSGLIFGGAVPLPLGGALHRRVGLGLGFQVPLAAINRARQPLPGEPIHVLLENRTHVVAVQVALGVKVSPRWRVGAGVLALAELGGTIDVATDAAGRFTTVSEQQLNTRMTPIAGIRYLMPTRALALGLTFRGTSQSEYDILVTSDLGDTLPVSLPPVLIAGVAQYDPATVAVEAVWQAGPGLSLSGQLAYQRWSAFPLPTRNPVDGTAPQELPDFRDSAVPRAALEWMRPLGSGTLSVRGGYAFFVSPAPEQTGRQSFLDNHRHIGSAGLGLAWPEAVIPLYLDLWIQLHQLVARNHTKDPSRFGAGDELPFISMSTHGRIAVGGMTMGVDL